MSLWTQLTDRNLKLNIPFMRIGSAADRRYERYDCFIMGTMALTDRAIIFDGVVDSISLGGIQFRPATTHVLDRRGENVAVGLGHREFHGTVVATRQSGYGVALQTSLESEELADILEEYALDG